MEWSEAEPVLKATYRLLQNSDHTSGDDVIAELGGTPGDEATGRILEALNRADYIDGRFVMETPVPFLITATEKGLQEASGWPKPGSSGSEQVQLLLRLLDEQIEDDATPEEERSKLRKARDGFASLGRDVAVGVLTAYASQISGAGGA